MVKRVAQLLPVFLFLGLGLGLTLQRHALKNWLKRQTYFTVRKVDIQVFPSVAGPAGHEDFLGFVGLHMPFSLFDVQIPSLKKRFLAIPGIRSIEIRREFPETLHLTLGLYVPKAIISLDELYFVDADGVIFKVLSPRDSKDFPLITGLGRESFMRDPARVQKAIRHALAFLEILEEDPQQRLTAQEISELHLRERVSFAEPTWDLSVILTQGPTEIRLGGGPLGEMRQRWHRFMAFKKSSGEDLRNYLGLDFRFTGQVVATPRIPHMIAMWE